MEGAVDDVVTQNSESVARTALTVILTVAGNVLQAPEEAKFRRIKLSNATVRSKVATALGAVELLHSIGFDASEPDVLVLPMDADLDRVIQARQAITSALNSPKLQPLALAPTTAATVSSMGEGATRVQLIVYDLSGGAARGISGSLLGIQMDIVPHTGISIYGVEYFFSGGVQCEALGVFSLNSNVPVHTTLDLGHTEIPKELFEEFCAELERQRFHAESYSLLDNNCNHFTNECANFLLGVSIPHDILHLPNRVLATPMGQMLRPMFETMGRPLNNALQGGGAAGGGAVSYGSPYPLFAADDISGLPAPPHQAPAAAPAPSAAAPRAAATPSAPFSPATPSLMGPPRPPPHAAATPATSAHRGAPAATPATVLQPRSSGAMSTPAAHAAARPAAPQSGGRLSALRAPPSSFNTPMAGGPLSKSSRPLLACEGETAAVAARLAAVAAPLAQDEAQRVVLASLDASLRAGPDAADAEPLGRLFASLLQSLGGANQFVLLYATRLLSCEPCFARAWLGGGALATLVAMLNAPPPEAASAGARVMGFVAVSNLVATREGLAAMASAAPAADASALLGAALAAAALPGAGVKEAQAAAALLQNLALSIRELAPSPGDAPLMERARLQLLGGLAGPLAVQEDPEALRRLTVALGSLVAQMLDSAPPLPRPPGGWAEALAELLTELAGKASVAAELVAMLREVRTMVKRL